MPESTLRAWAFGRRYPNRGGGRRMLPVIIPPTKGFLSFTNLVEAHTLAGMRRDHQLRLEKIRPALGGDSAESRPLKKSAAEAG